MLKLLIHRKNLTYLHLDYNFKEPVASRLQLQLEACQNAHDKGAQEVAFRLGNIDAFLPLAVSILCTAIVDLDKTNSPSKEWDDMRQEITSSAAVHEVALARLRPELAEL
jgi:hypothetical protein